MSEQYIDMTPSLSDGDAVYDTSESISGSLGIQFLGRKVIGIAAHAIDDKYFLDIYHGTFAGISVDEPSITAPNGQPLPPQPCAHIYADRELQRLPMDLKWLMSLMFVEEQCDRYNSDTLGELIRYRSQDFHRVITSDWFLSLSLMEQQWLLDRLLQELQGAVTAHPQASGKLYIRSIDEAGESHYTAGNQIAVEFLIDPNQTQAYRHENDFSVPELLIRLSDGADSQMIASSRIDFIDSYMADTSGDEQVGGANSK